MIKCSRKGCNNRFNIPAWKYCSDECRRLVDLEKRSRLRDKKKLKNKRSHTQ